MDNILVSIVMTVYNSKSFLEKCIDSILNQTYMNFEFICINDGSTDTSLNILEDYEKNDPRLKIINQKNQGTGISRNAGLALAKGKYIIFLDSDDFFEPNMLEILVQKAEETNADVTICKTQCFDDSNDIKLPSEWLRKDKFLKGKTIVKPIEIKDSLFQFTYGQAWDKLFLLEFVRKNNILFPSLKNSEDLVFVYSLLPLSNKIAIVPEKLINYRMHRINSVSSSRINSPQEPFNAMLMLEEELIRLGLLDLYEKTFINWAMEFCIWNVVNLPKSECRKTEFIRIKYEYFPKYKFGKYPINYYYSKHQYFKFILIKCCSFSIFSAVVDCYQYSKKLFIKIFLDKFNISRK